MERQNSRMLAVGAIVSALAVVLLYISCVLPTLQLTAVAVAGVLSAAVLIECGPGRAALQQLRSRGHFYRTNQENYSGGSASGGCNVCDTCSSLILADCCCECMGGDLIPCC